MTFENIILGFIIGYLLYKIWSAIKKTPDSNDKVKVFSSINGQMVEVKIKDIANPVEVMSSLIEQDFPTFAKLAFSKISRAFAMGRLKEIETEVSPSVFKAFQNAVREREENKQHVDFTLISFVDVKVSTAPDHSSKDVEFTTEQINLLKDEKEKVIEGDPMHVATVKERWTFVKVANNWVLSAVKSGEGYLA